MKRFLAVLFWLVPLMGFSQQPNQVMAFSDGRMATPTNLFKTNIYSGTNIYAESYGSKGEVRINVVGSLGGNSSILINGISKTNVNLHSTLPGPSVAGAAPVQWNASTSNNVTGFIPLATKDNPGVNPAGSGHPFKVMKTDVDGNWTFADPGGGVTSINGLTNANHFFVLLTTGPGPFVTTNGTDTTILYIPYASWTNHGLLTSNLWQVFNDKAPSNYVETLSGTNGMFVRTEIVGYSNVVNSRIFTASQNATNYTDNHSNFVVATFGNADVTNTLTTGTNNTVDLVINGRVSYNWLVLTSSVVYLTTNAFQTFTTNDSFTVSFSGTPATGQVCTLLVRQEALVDKNLTLPADTFIGDISNSVSTVGIRATNVNWYTFVRGATNWFLTYGVVGYQPTNGVNGANGANGGVLAGVSNSAAGTAMVVDMSSTNYPVVNFTGTLAGTATLRMTNLTVGLQSVVRIKADSVDRKITMIWPDGVTAEWLTLTNGTDCTWTNWANSVTCASFLPTSLTNVLCGRITQPVAQP